MSSVLDIFFNQFIIFVLVLSRIGGLVMTAPIFGAKTVPIRIRGFIAVALAMLLTPVHWNAVIDRPDTLVNLLILISKESVIGITLGLGIAILFMGLQVAGQIVAQMSALSLADVFDPSFDSNASIFAQLFNTIALSVFLIIGGHRVVMDGLLDTFRTMPPGQATFHAGVTSALVDVLSQSFVLGIRGAAPAIVALLLTILVMGLISRTLPQLNILAVGFSVNTMILMGTLTLSLGAIVWIFLGNVEPTIDSILTTFERKP